MGTYEVSVKWKPGDEPYKRMATLSSPNDGLPEIVVVTPPEFKHGIAGEWSPEHLFVASAAVCFFTTFMSISEGSKLGLKDVVIRASGEIGKDANGKSWISSIDLYPSVIIDKESEAKKAEKILQKAENNCLISNSMKTPVSIHPEIKTG